MSFRFFRLTEMLRFSALLCLPLFLVGSMLAQNTTGTLRGQVADFSGAIIPGASITLIGNGKTRSTTSGGTDDYRFNAVPPSQYTVHTSIDGFTPYALEDLSIPAGKTSTLNISMMLAVQEQEVQVHAESNTIDTMETGLCGAAGDGEEFLLSRRFGQPREGIAGLAAGRGSRRWPARADRFRHQRVHERARPCIGRLCKFRRRVGKPSARRTARRSGNAPRWMSPLFPTPTCA